MTSIRIRPRFKEESNLSQTEVEARIKAHLSKPDTACTGTVIPSHIVIRIPHEKRHFWSPQLSLSLEEEDNQTHIRGLFGPNPTVWALFAFGYSVLGILGLFIGIIGMSRKSLDLNAPILWLLPVFAVLAIILYFTAQAGQRLGHDEMETLKQFYHTSMESGD